MKNKFFTDKFVLTPKFAGVGSMEVIMADTINFSVRMDSDIKKQCESLYNELGMNLTTAINVFLRQSIRAGGFPFDVRLEQPNRETVAAMLEAERIAHDPNVKRYSDVEEALRELKR